VLTTRTASERGGAGGGIQQQGGGCMTVELRSGVGEVDCGRLSPPFAPTPASPGPDLQCRLPPGRDLPPARSCSEASPLEMFDVAHAIATVDRSW
jgi:hypothetical protein